TSTKRAVTMRRSMDRSLIARPSRACLRANPSPANATPGQHGVNFSRGALRCLVCSGGNVIASRCRDDMGRIGRSQMPRLISRGRFTQEYAKRLVGAPEDREPAVRKLVEASGGKLLNLYFTTGDADFVIIAEGETEAIIATLMAAAA